MAWAAFYDRDLHSIEGRFTLKDSAAGAVVIGDKLRRLRARSGQRGYESTSWQTGKSPIPFGHWRLWLNRTVSRGVLDLGRAGIGEFRPISSGDAPGLIQCPDHESQVRRDIGLHPENALPGSAGCIVLLHETPEEVEAVRLLFEKLDAIGKDTPWIPLVVL